MEEDQLAMEVVDEWMECDEEQVAVDETGEAGVRKGKPKKVKEIAAGPAGDDLVDEVVDELVDEGDVRRVSSATKVKAICAAESVVVHDLVDEVVDGLGDESWMTKPEREGYAEWEAVRGLRELGDEQAMEIEMSDVEGLGEESPLWKMLAMEIDRGEGLEAPGDVVLEDYYFREVF